MKKKMAILLAAVLLISGLPFFGMSESQAASSDIRVLISAGSPQSLKMTVKGSYVLGETGASFTDGSLTLSADGNKVTATHSSQGELYTGKSISINRTDMSTSGGYVKFNDRQYLGNFTITASGSQLIVVNTLPLQQYLYGVVGYEMSNTWPVEALKAQAVAAKNYALVKMTGGGSYDIRDTAADQVYKGYSSNLKNVISAVDGTIDKALYLGNDILICYYSASNGGYSILPSANWGDTKYDAAYATGTDPFDLRNSNCRKEELYIPKNLARRSFSSAALYTFIMDKLNASVQQGVVADGYLFDSFTGIESIISTNDKGVITTDGDHSQIIITAKLNTKIDPSVATPEPTSSPTPEPTEEPTPTPTEEPTPEPTTEPTPEVTQDPDATADPNATETPEPTPVVTSTPKPKETAEVENEPTPTPYQSIKERTETTVVTITFEEMEAAGLFTDTSLRIYYVITAEGGWTLFHGRFGHGVGMSQRGAQQMANEGWTYDQILSFYYPGAELRDYAYTSSMSGATASASTTQAAAEETPAPADTQEDSQTTTPEPENTLTQEAPEETVVPQTTTTTSGSTNENGIAKRDTVLFSGASINSTQTEQVAANAKLQITNIKGEWYLVRDLDTGKVGYLPYTDVTITGDKALATGTVSGSGVNLRSAPGTDNESIGKLDLGETVSVLEIGDGWYRVKSSSGSTGWMSGEYLTLTGSAASSAKVTATDTQDTSDEEESSATPTPVILSILSEETETSKKSEIIAYGTANTDDAVLRTGPSASTTELGSYSSGTPFAVYSKVGNWYNVKLLATGQQGYMDAKYLNLIGNDSAEEKEKTTGKIISSGAVLRQGPSTSYRSIGRLHRNALVTVLGSSGNWYRVKVASTGEEGYVFGRYMTFDTTKKETGNTGVSGQAVVSSGLMNMYDKADEEKGKIIAAIRRGYTVTIQSINGEWAEIRFNGETGYCRTKYLSIQ